MHTPLATTAVVLDEPKRLRLGEVKLLPPGDGDVVVDVAWSGISTGTERLLWSGRMPAFPGMGYPLVPGYELVGRISACGREAGRREVGELVFVPGANCYKGVRGLFGGAARRLVVPAQRVLPVSERLGERGVLLALLATAHHVTGGVRSAQPDLIVGHGVLGRLVARIAVALGAPAPTVWEVEETRRDGARGYSVIDPSSDERRDYRRVVDVSGDAGLLDTLIGRLHSGGEIVLAGFYSDRLSFSFPPAFMREARLRVAAQWHPADLEASCRLVEEGRLSLDGLISHTADAREAPAAYETAFGDVRCLKMVLDWRSLQ